MKNHSQNKASEKLYSVQNQIPAANHLAQIQIKPKFNSLTVALNHSTIEFDQYA